MTNRWHVVQIDASAIGRARRVVAAILRHVMNDRRRVLDHGVGVDRIAGGVERTDAMLEGSDSILFREVVPDDGGALFTLDWVPAGARALYRHRDIRGFGDFADVRRMVLTQVAR